MNRVEVIRELQKAGYTVWPDSAKLFSPICLIWKVSPEASALLHVHGELRDANGKYLPSYPLTATSERTAALKLLRGLLMEMEAE